MHKLIIFDLDGVLIESRELHYESLNSALRKVGEQFVISREEHLSTFDGLNTTKKLNLLAETKGLPADKFDQIWQDKQKATFELIPNAPTNMSIQYIVMQLKRRGWKVAVASNSIRETVRIALDHIGILNSVDYYVSNEDVFRAKPFPEMYWKCMTALNCLPKDTIIVEDSHIGREGATNSGAHLYPVKDAYELNGIKFIDMIEEFERQDMSKNIPWRNKKMNVLIPMAGAGSRFAQAGYTFPKPLIEVNGKPMIQVVVENLNIDATYIYIVQKKHREKYNLDTLLNLITPNCKIVEVDGITEGAACTTLLAKEYINNDEPLLMANSDQYVEWNSNECLYAFTADSIDAGILTFEATHPKWSYAKIFNNNIIEVAEKKVISNNATVGIYYWAKGSDYVKYAEQMIQKDIRVNNEFYVCPVFNEAIGDGKKIKTFEIEKMWGLGTPEDLNAYLQYKKLT